MKYIKLSLPIILIFIFILSSAVDVNAQRRKKKKRRRPAKKENVKEIIPLKDRLWYGANANLNLYNSAFVFGINPMVGYKFNSWLSVGPEIILDYVQFKEKLGTEYKNIRVLDYGAGIFARAKILDMFFFQTEYNFVYKGTATFDPVDPNDYIVEREYTPGAFVGVGYTNGGEGMWGYQATLLLNLLDDPRSSRVPFSIKLGVAYNF